MLIVWDFEFHCTSIDGRSWSRDEHEPEETHFRSIPSRSSDC